MLTYLDLLRKIQLLKMNNDLERVGDLSVKIVRRLQHFSKNDYNIKKIKIARGLCPTSSLRKAEDELLIMNY